MSSPKRKSHSPTPNSSSPPSLRSRTLISKRTIFHLEVTSPKNTIKEKEREREKEKAKTTMVSHERKKHQQLITTRTSPRKDKVTNRRKANHIQPPSPDLLLDDLLRFQNPSQNKSTECDQVEDEISSGLSDTKEEDDSGKISDSPLDWTPRLRNDKIVANSRESSQDSEKDLVHHFESNFGMSSPPSSAPPSRSPSFLSKLIPPPKNTQNTSPYRPPLNTLSRTISPPIKRIKHEISPEKIIVESVVIPNDLSLSLSSETKLLSSESKLSRSDTVCIVDGAPSLPKVDHNITNPNTISHNVTTVVQSIEMEADVNKISSFQSPHDDKSVANESGEYGNNVNSNVNNSNNNTHNNTNHINGHNPDPRLQLEFTDINSGRNDVNCKPENCMKNLVKELENTILQLNDQIRELKCQNSEYQQTIVTQKENYEKGVVDYQSRISVLTSQRSELEDKVGQTIDKMGNELLKTEKVEREAHMLFKLLRTEVERAKRLEMQLQLLKRTYTNDNNNNNNNSNILNNNNISCSPENEELEVLKDKVFMMEMQLAKSNMLWKKTR